MKDIIFNFSDQKVRVILKNKEPYFCLSDVGKVLNLSNAYRQAKQFIKGVHTMHTPTAGGAQEIIYISEPNLYKLIFKSRKENAEKFQDWVFEEVLPSIRKTGKYSIPDNINKISTQNRNALTDEWKSHGIEKPHHYIQLTLQEYKALGFEKGKKKKDLTRSELLLLSALESMETLKLFHDKEEKDYYQCRDSLIDTSNNVKELTKKEVIE